MRSYVIRDDILLFNPSQVLESRIFSYLLKEFVEILEEKSDHLLEALEPFKKGKNVNYRKLREILMLLTVKPLTKLETSLLESLLKRREVLIEFVEALYNFWREKHRFAVKRAKYTRTMKRKLSLEYEAIRIGENFEASVRELYRRIMYNLMGKPFKVMRQLPSGFQVIFLVDKLRSSKVERWMKDIPIVWGAVLRPPVIFYTRSNKRKGIFPVKEGKGPLEHFKPSEKNWLCFPIYVGKYFFLVFVQEEFLCHGTGLLNLFEITDPLEIGDRKPDGVVIFGIPERFLQEDEKRGVIYRMNDTYYAFVGDSPETDYFGYMKKITLTVHNLKVLEEGRLPVHGALARVKLKSGKTVNLMFVGDSGAGKSETLDALERLDEISEIRIIADDMASLAIENGKVVAYGTEIGAFVRLDDLPPGYAYHTMDRSIFMNPDQINARVIVPFGNYEEIIKPTPVEYFLYANNYTYVGSENERLVIFKRPEEALRVFSEGKRKAKGTTGEVGLTSSYFANPFGAVQRRKEHEKIAESFLKKMFETGVRVGEIRTMLGINGFEKEGPRLAAISLLKMVERGSL
ncbi:MAG: hypothetical protein DRP24_01275 [Thermotoga sp.]|nr:MAG: hypothetical protein DRP24_01275 [Thermotoga sp.]